MAKQKPILVVARDAGPSNALKLVVEELTRRGHEVQAFLGGGKPIQIGTDSAPVDAVMKYLADLARGSKLVLTGLSYPEANAHEEFAAVFGTNNTSVPVAVFGDIPLCHVRAKDRPAARRAALYFATSKADAKLAETVFVNAKCIGAGNPSWDDLFVRAADRDDMRAKFDVGPKHHVILVVGGKDVEGSMFLFALTIEAVTRLIEYRVGVSKDYLIVVSQHPGDQTDYSPFLQSRRRTYSPKVRYIPSNVGAYTTAANMVGADLVIAFGSTEDKRAAALLFPHLTPLVPRLIERNESMTGERLPEAVRSGFSIGVEADPNVLAGAILATFLPGGVESLMARQAECFPEPRVRGAATKKICDAIEELLAT